MSVVDLRRSGHFTPNDVLMHGSVLTLSSLPTQKRELTLAEQHNEDFFYRFLLSIRDYPNLCALFLQVALQSKLISPQYLGGNGTTTTALEIARIGGLHLVRGGDQMKNFAAQRVEQGFANEGVGWEKFLEHIRAHPEIDFEIDRFIRNAILQDLQRHKGVVLDAKIWKLLIDLRRFHPKLPESFPIPPNDLVTKNPFHVVVEVDHDVANTRLNGRNNGHINDVESYRHTRWRSDFLRFLHLYGLLFTRSSLLHQTNAIIHAEESALNQAQEFWNTMQITFGPGILTALRG